MLLSIYRKLWHIQLSVMTLQVFQMHFNLYCRAVSGVTQMAGILSSPGTTTSAM